MADVNPDDNQQDSTAVDFSSADTDGGDKCDNNGDITTASSSNSSVAEGLYSLISSVMTGFDSRAEATSRSQDQLEFSLDRLTGELDKLLEDAPLPFIMQHAARISGVRKRVKALNTVLKSIQRRIDNMDRIMSAGLAHETLGEKAVSNNRLCNGAEGGGPGKINGFKPDTSSANVDKNGDITMFWREPPKP
ncbi:hypothetical protein DH2020_040351 [Rehmannia glutinosa]|uniref:Biogenesis of lysosome-related organelles complex 1 subunit 7 n=1 Tax=Rehmannia glutinosa TaxID=99300 RepID=A0ABR0UUD7_REHGL